MSRQYTELRARIARLGLTQTGLARRMKEFGDDRSERNILRSIPRMVAGDVRFSGEMRALLGLMEQTRVPRPVSGIGPSSVEQFVEPDRVIV